MSESSPLRVCNYVHTEEPEGDNSPEGLLCRARGCEVHVINFHPSWSVPHKAQNPGAYGWVNVRMQMCGEEIECVDGTYGGTEVFKQDGCVAVRDVGEVECC